METQMKRVVEAKISKCEMELATMKYQLNEMHL